MLVLSRKKQEEYNSNPKKCKNCGNLISYKKRENDCCSQRCGAIFNQKAFPRTMGDEQKKLLSSIAIKNDSAKNFRKFQEDHKRPILTQKCLYCGNDFSYPCGKNDKIRKFCSANCRDNGANHIDHSKSGGYRKNSGKGKQGWYKGYHCQSSWELAWVIYNLEHNIRFERNQNGFEYIFKGKTHKYFPDFYLSDEKCYIEIKGWPNEQTSAKIAQFDGRLNVLYKGEMKPILEYVTNKYGNNFIELYEGNPYKTKNNKCILCGKPAKNKYCSRLCSGKNVARLSPCNKKQFIGQ